MRQAGTRRDRTTAGQSPSVPVPVRPCPSLSPKPDTTGRAPVAVSSPDSSAARRGGTASWLGSPDCTADRSGRTGSGASLPAILADLVADQTIWPGDGILYRYAEPSWLQRAIARTQSRALLDLLDISAGSIPGEVDPDPRLPVGPYQLHPALYTHAGMVASASGTVEMTSPRCRMLPWHRRLQGIAKAVIVRPRGATRRQTCLARADALEDVAEATPYPHREIVLYWLWSWGFRKLRMRTPFSRVFRSRSRNVCSGSLMQWWDSAGIPVLGDEWPEAWYPARLLVDPRFEIVAILGGAATSMSPIGTMRPMPPLSGDRSQTKPSGRESSPPCQRSQAARHTADSASPASSPFGVKRSAFGVRRSHLALSPAGGSPSFLPFFCSSSLLLSSRASGGALLPRLSAFIPHP